MRLPGFYHLKDKPQQTKIIFESSQLPFSRERFLNAFDIGLSERQESLVHLHTHSENNTVLEALKRFNLLIRKEFILKDVGQLNALGSNFILQKTLAQNILRMIRNWRV